MSDFREKHKTPQWIDVAELSFDVMLLLEYCHLLWFPRLWLDNELGKALKYNKNVYQYFCMMTPENCVWIDHLVAKAGCCNRIEIRQSEIAVMKKICDWIVYVYCPEEYDNQLFLKWNNDELLSLTKFNNKVIADIGSGTGRLLEPVISFAQTLYAVEPVERLRRFIRSKFSANKDKLFVLDGLITDIPLPDDSCDVLLSGHVYGDNPETELDEIERVTRSGGIVILCPGNLNVDNDIHRVLVDSGYQWSVLHQPVDIVKRKYWKNI